MLRTASPPTLTPTPRYKEKEGRSAPSGPGVLLRGGEKRGITGRTLVVSFSLHQHTVGDAVVISKPKMPVVPGCARNHPGTQGPLLLSSALSDLKAATGPAPVMKHTLAPQAISWDGHVPLRSGSFGGSRSYGHTLLQVVGRTAPPHAGNKDSRKSRGCIRGQGPTRGLNWSSPPRH